jgi:hypothetical protein
MEATELCSASDGASDSHSSKESLFIDEINAKETEQRKSSTIKSDTPTPYTGGQNKTEDGHDDEQFLTIAGAISKGEVRPNNEVSEKKGVTGIDLMIAGHVEFKDYNLQELQGVVKELLVQEYLEYEKMMVNDPDEIEDYKPVRLVRRVTNY